MDLIIIYYIIKTGKDGIRGEDGEVGLPGVAGAPGPRGLPGEIIKRILNFQYNFNIEYNLIVIIDHIS